MAQRWTLQDEIDWCHDQAENENNTLEDRALWAQLAEELESRVVALPTQPEQLF
jgi:hypothetical protein